MSEPISRLNLIERAVQLRAISPEPVRIEAAGLQQTRGRPNDGRLERKRIDGAPIKLSRDPEPATLIPNKSEPVRLNYARLSASRIVTPDNKASATYNEFRALKRKLLPMTHDPETGAMTRNVVVVTSALPGEGKTFTTMNLALALADEPNLNVILIDGDVVRNSIAHYFEAEDQDGLLELLTGKRERIEDVLHPCADVPGLHVVFAGRHHDSAPELLASRGMAEVCAALSKRFQQCVVLIDMPPVLATSEPAAMAAHAHHLIMLVAAGQAARHQVEAALTEVSRCPSISLVFNRSPQWERPLSNLYSFYGYGLDRSGGA
jgi:protein-tyrosine kinase